MAKIATVFLSIQIVGDGLNETFNISGTDPIVNPAAPGGGPLAYALLTGDNTIPVPPGTLAWLLVPPANSTIAKKLKGVGGDTGYPLLPNLPALMTVAVGATSILINVSASENVSIHWI